MKLYYVYILKCSDGLTYTGITNNIARRLEEHQKGMNKTCFTNRRRPVTLIFQQEFNIAEQAIAFEKKIKKWSNKKKIALANGEFEELKLLAECKNETRARNIDTGVGLTSRLRSK